MPNINFAWLCQVHNCDHYCPIQTVFTKDTLISLNFLRNICLQKNSPFVDQLAICETDHLKTGKFYVLSGKKLPRERPSLFQNRFAFLEFLFKINRLNEKAFFGHQSCYQALRNQINWLLTGPTAPTPALSGWGLEARFDCAQGPERIEGHTIPSQSEDRPGSRRIDF